MGAQWRKVVTDLDSDHRCVLPTLPMGAHRRPMRPDADLSLRGMRRLLAEFIKALDLQNVTLCFNDWCGAQVMIADGLMERVERLVLVSCEAFDNYPPGLPGRMAARSAKLPGAVPLMERTLRLRRMRRLPIALGWMSKRGVPDEVVDEWLRPLRRPEIRRDFRKYAGDTKRGQQDLARGDRSASRFRPSGAGRLGERGPGHATGSRTAARPTLSRQPGSSRSPTATRSSPKTSLRCSPWTAGPLVRQIIEACEAAPSGAEKLHVLADGYIAIYKASGDIMRIVTDAAAAAPGAAEFLETANARHHEALIEIVAQIRETGDLKMDLSDEDAARIIYYHFRFEQLTLAIVDFGWGEDRARDWIRERVESALLDA
jgi:pimeloyl-ACP methyl ester carboxylesterase